MQKPTANKVWNKGDLCKVVYAADKRTYLARIKSLASNKATVRYLQYEAEEEHLIESLKPAPDWQVGDKCQALYSADGNHYPAIIKEIKPDEDVVVEFDGYAEEVAVKVTDLLPLEGDKVQEANEQGTAQGS